MARPSESIKLYKLVQFHLDDLNLDNYNDFVDEDFFNFTSQETHKYTYNFNLSPCPLD